MTAHFPSRHLLAAATLAVATQAAAHNAISTRALLIGAALQAPAVSNCNDSGPGSLRYALLHASNQDIVSLAALTCGKITLGSALTIEASVDELEIHGNGITLDGNGTDRVLAHGGHGRLTLSNMTIQHGFYGGPFGGGCIYSAGIVQLRSSKVSNCTLYTIDAASGGGIYAPGGVVVGSSTVSDSHAISLNGAARGGGIYSKGDIFVDFDSTSISGSTISGNTASSPTGNAFGGGLFTNGYTSIESATLSENAAYQCAALRAVSATIGNSTVSGNISRKFAAVVVVDGVQIFDSTITANVTGSAKYSAGLYTSSGQSLINSSIIAGNLTAAGAAAIDFGKSASSTVTFSKSLVREANFTLPASVLRDDPKLGPLAYNGGRTKTHALLPGSPAIGAGEDEPYIDWDQRGKPFARKVGVQDIGAVESSDRFFFDGFDP